MPEETPGFGESNAPERAGGIVRDHVRAVIESAEGNAAEIRRRASGDAESLDTARADSASRLTTQLGELEGSFTRFGERLGQEVLPSGSIKGELGAGSESEHEEPAPTPAPSAWRAPAEAGAQESAEESVPSTDEEEGLLGGLRKRFSGPAAEDSISEPSATAERPAEPAPTAEPSDFVPAGDEPSGAASSPTPGAAAPPGDESPSAWVPAETAEQDAAEQSDSEGSDSFDRAGADSVSTDEKAGDDPPDPEPGAGDNAEARSEAQPIPGGQAGSEPPESVPGAQPKPRGRVARLLLGKRPDQ